MTQTPIEVVGSGFVVGVPGIFGNTIIPLPGEENIALAPDLSDTSLSPPASSVPQATDTPTAQISDTPAPQPRKAQAAKATNQE